MSASLSPSESVDALEAGDRIRLPGGRVLTIEKIDRSEWRPDRFKITEAANGRIGPYSHRDYDLQRAFEGGAEVLTR